MADSFAECLQLPGLDMPNSDLATNTQLLQLIIVYLLTQTLHRCIFKPLRLPPLISQMLAGVLLSHFLKGNAVIFPGISSSVWLSIAGIGNYLSVYIIALKMDLGLVLKTGQKACVASILGLMIPIVICRYVASFMQDNLSNSDDQTELWEIFGIGSKSGTDDLVLISTLLGDCFFQVVALLLGDLGLLNSELGRLATSSALIYAIVKLFIYVLVAEMIDSDRDGIINVMSLVMITLVAWLFLRPLMKKIVQHTPKDRPVKTGFVLLVFFFGMAGGIAMKVIGKQPITTGVFIMAAATPAGPPLGSAIVDVFDSFLFGILQPFFVTVTVMRADVLSINFSDDATLHHLALAVLADGTKIIMCLVCAWCTSMSFIDGLTLGVILNTKGFFNLGAYELRKERYVITSPTFSVLVLCAIISAIYVPTLVKLLYNPSRKYMGYQRRDIMHMKQTGELRILPCIYRHDNVAAITNLLDICNPTKHNPIVSYILHLVKLSGQLQATFISHDLQKKKATTKHSDSDEIVRAFDRYQSSHVRRYPGGLTTHIFTAVTLHNAMHEDICTIALDNSISLIVLPFHRKLGLDGSVDSEYSDQRSINLSILNHAPSSVAVYIHRGQTQKAAIADDCQLPGGMSIAIDSMEIDFDFKVGVVFIGGNDDQEVVALAKWMARGGRVRIHLLRLMAEKGKEEKSSATELDMVVIEDIRTGIYKDRFSYRELTVKHGGETATVLREMADEFDLIIVGRRCGSECVQTTGLKEWSEVPELGVIGDVLAAPDLVCRASVLVVQRQKIIGEREG